MDGYYDWHPTRVPQIPISLIGPLGAHQELVGRVACQLSGLTLADVDRSVEHEAGMSVAQLILEQGEAEYRRREAEWVERSLRARPAGLIVLGEGALLDPRSRELVTEQSALVYVHHEIADLVARIDERRERVPAVYFPWIPQDGADEAYLTDLVESRLPTYEDAVLQINGTRQTLEKVASALLKHFDLLPSPRE